MQRTAIIIDDHPMCRQATTMALHAVDPRIAVVEAASLAEARPHVAGAVLMTLDLALPDNPGALGLPAVRSEFPDVPILVISGANNPDTECQVAMTGAQGYLSKAARISEMTAAMRALLAAGRWFSPDLDLHSGNGSDFARITSLSAAQGRVLHAMVGGRLNKQIAFDLGLSEITIKAHVKAILKKLGVHNRTQAILMLRRVEA